MSRVPNTLRAAAILLLAIVSPAAAEQPWPDAVSSARIEIAPKETEVFVDGYLAGTADDFDGLWQRLRLPAGEYELQFFLEGHRTITEKLLLQPGQSYHIRHRMEPLSPGEPPATRPKPTAVAASAVTTSPRYGPRRPLPSRETPGMAGSLSLRILPADAVVTIDGERWETSDPSARLVVELSDGEHRVDVQKEGYTPFTTTVQVRSGEVTLLNVSLSRAPGPAR